MIFVLISRRRTVPNITVNSWKDAIIAVPIIVMNIVTFLFVTR